MTGCEVVVKGEIHSSRGDHSHEREILTEGVDHVILEGPKEQAEYGIFQQWYAFAMLLTEYLFFRVFYTDSSVLEDIAYAQDADVWRTRESDAAILENSHIFVRVSAAFLFILLFFGSSLAGISGNDMVGVPLLLLSLMLPILVLRLHESSRSDNSRNDLMADRILQVLEDDDRVVAIVGESHADEICDRIPPEINLERQSPVYPVYSLSHLRDIAYPTFVSISVLWVFYSLFVAYSEFAWTIS